MLAQPHEQSVLRNTILARLSREDLGTVSPFLHPVNLKERMVLQEPRRPAENVYFIESGLVSLRTAAAGNVIETALIGSRGVVGVSVALGSATPVHQSIVLFPGRALQIAAVNLRRLMNERPLIRENLLLHAQALMVYGAQTALCCAKHDPAQRVASWLSLACEGLSATTLPITHDQLSTILGMRRATVTEALLQFEDLGLIRKLRGVLEVCDRALLEQRTCSCYGIIRRACFSEH